MNLSSYLQSPDFIESLPRRSADELRNYVFTRGGEWFEKYPEESLIIVKNLRAFGIPHNSVFLKRVQTHILLHYYEKLLPLCLPPQDYHAYLTKRVAMPPELDALRAAVDRKNGVVIAVCHFGAVECIGPALSARGLGLTGVLRFATPQLSAAVRGRTAALAATGLFSPMDFVEIGNPRSPAALDMAAVLRRGGALLAVFDERTEYSVPASLFRKQVWGGAGLHRLVQLARPGAAVYTAFATRNDNETYDLSLHEVAGTGADLVQAMYRTLEPLLGKHCDQWYFLHEEIPFVT